MLEKFLNNKLTKLGYVKKEELEEVREKLESNNTKLLSSIKESKEQITNFETNMTSWVTDKQKDTDKWLDAFKEDLSVTRQNLVEVEDRLEDELNARESVLLEFREEIDKKTATPKNQTIREIKDEIENIKTRIQETADKVEELRLIPGEYVAIKQMFETYKKKINKDNADTVAKAEATEEAMRAFDEVYNSMIQRTNKKVGHINSQTWKEIDDKAKASPKA